MDNNLLTSFVAGGSSGAFVGIFYIIYKVFKHSSCRSNCCGAKSSFSIDLERGLNSPTSTEKNNITVVDEPPNHHN